MEFAKRAIEELAVSAVQTGCKGSIGVEIPVKDGKLGKVKQVHVVSSGSRGRYAGTPTASAAFCLRPCGDTPLVAGGMERTSRAQLPDDADDLDAAAALTAAFLWAYWPTLVKLVETWNREPDYSHGFLGGAVGRMFSVGAA